MGTSLMLICLHCALQGHLVGLYGSFTFGILDWWHCPYCQRDSNDESF